MNRYLDPKAVVVGLIISLITAGISLSLAPTVFPKTGSSVNFSGWNLESPKSLALSMDQSLPNLIYGSVLTGVVASSYIENVQTWNIDLEPFFLSRIASFKYFPIIDNDLIGTSFLPNDPIFKIDNWELEFLECCPYLDNSITLADTQSFQDKLQNGLNADISSFTSLTNITFTIDEQIKIAEMQEDVFYWEIRHVYNDGTKIEIKAYGNIIIITQAPIIEILHGEEGFSFNIDQEKIPFPSYYTVTPDNPFVNYEYIINDVFNTILDNNE